MKVFRNLAILYVLIAVFATAQTPADPVLATFSLEPFGTYQATFGGRLAQVALYSVEVCSDSATGATVPAGLLRQAAETSAHLNWVDSTLAGATAAKAQAHTKLSAAVSFTKWALTGVTVLAAVVTATKSTSTLSRDALEVGAAGTALFQGIQIPLNSAQATAQSTAQAALSNILDTSTTIAIPAHGCAPSKLFFATYVKAFQPVTATVR